MKQTAIKIVKFGLWSAAVTLLPAAAVSSPDGGALVPEAVVSEILSNNPSLKAAHANWEAMKQRIPQARAWEDLRVGLDGVAGRFVDVPPNSFTDLKYMAEQTLPLAGKNRLRAQAVSAEAVAAYEELRRRELDLTARARAACYRLANAHAQLELNRRNESLLQQFVEISRAKYEVGRQSQADVLLAETDLARLAETRYDIERQIAAEESQLNVLMNRPVRQLLGRPAQPPAPPLEFSPEQIESLALAHRPELLAAEKKIDAAKARWEAARRERIPEPSVRVEASHYNESRQTISEVAVGFSINVPWLNRAKYHAAVEEARNLREGAEYELVALRTETLGLVRDQLKKVETFHHHFQLFQSRIIPLAGQSVKASQAAYETDRAGFLELLIARRNLQEAEAMYQNHLADYLIARAELEALVGASLDRAADGLKQNK